LFLVVIVLLILFLIVAPLMAVPGELSDDLSHLTMTHDVAVVIQKYTKTKWS